MSAALDRAVIDQGDTPKPKQRKDAEIKQSENQHDEQRCPQARIAQPPPGANCQYDNYDGVEKDDEQGEEIFHSFPFAPRVRHWGSWTGLLVGEPAARHARIEVSYVAVVT